MSTDQNKALLRRLFEEGVNQNKLNVFDELLAPDFIIYDAQFGTSLGPEGMREGIELFKRSFPDLHVTFEAEYAYGDYVFHRGYITGTHTGEFQGIPPTGKQFKINSIDIWRVVNGKAVENWVQMDMLSLMQQIGVISTPTRGAK